MTGNQIAKATQPLLNKLTRRHALSYFGAGGFATAFVFGSNIIAKASDEDNSASKLVKTWVNAYNELNAIAMANLYTSDGIFEDVPNNFQVQGPSNIQCLMQNNQKALGDIKLQLTSVLGQKDFAVAQYSFSATNTGFISDPTTIGKSFEVPVATIFVIKNKKIARSTDYYDDAAIFVQVGLIPPFPNAAPPATNC